LAVRVHVVVQPWPGWQTVQAVQEEEAAAVE
jgi:hypothetical protein